ncbi:unnamed protein product [Urochloa decumbens]|uniref:Uncharacterized protein n=1 Tax=Urochloa decumbens TaxID=240449 RepID=A0ABC9BLK0_9POAL
MAAVRSSHLAGIICLAFLHLLAGEYLLVNSLMNTTTTTTLAPHAPIPLLASDTGRATSSLTDVSPPRHLEREDAATAPASTAPTTPLAAPPCRGAYAVHAPAPAVDDTLLAPRGIAAPPFQMAALLKALPLLAIPFLPPPLGALVALAALATPVRACSFVPSASCSGLTHGSCTVYRYHHGNGTVDRAKPFAGLRNVCPHPRCDDGSDSRARSTAYGRCRGRHDDPFHGYCSVRTLELEILPEGKAWRIMPAHLPVADPAAVVAAGGDVCYVELEHMGYREGYFIRCPVCDCRHVPVLCCTEFPHNAIAAAVWEHRRLTYRDTVGRRTNGTATPRLQGLEYHDEL